MLVICSVADPDTGSGALFTSGSGIEKKIRIRDKHFIIFPRAYSLVKIFGLKILKICCKFMLQLRIRDLGWKHPDPGPGGKTTNQG
jgi:hypothetical protein